MYIHPDKTKVIAFGPKRKLRNNVLYVKYNYVGLEQVNYIKYLGVTIDSQLLWSKHIESICSKVSRSIGCIRVRLSSLFWLETTFEMTFRVIWEMINAKLF